MLPTIAYMTDMNHPEHSPRLRFASYNVRKTRGLDQKRKPHRTIAVLNTLEADVVALQEADHRLGDRPAALTPALIEAETDFTVAPVARSARSLGWHGNAVLLRKGLGVAAITHVDLPGLEPRGAVRVDIAAATPVAVVATHLGLMRRHRQHQLTAITRAVADAEHAVVLGDFNEWSADRGLDPLRDRFDVHAPGRSFHAARPVAALDRIAVLRSAHVHDAGVEQGALAKRASDHLPVWADISWDDGS